ncbi:DUF6531 domain-containing protein [Marinobacter sp. OP 3.4]|uniref:DUF6531 domain-containing protein n=1 Tax=Marinobacter sp. OP 3.4 TaxID=3076501 RepID=UPI002E24B705
MEKFTAIDGTMYAIGAAEGDIGAGTGTRIEKTSAQDYAAWLNRAFNRYFDDYRQRWGRLGGRPTGQMARNASASHYYIRLGQRLESGELLAYQLPSEAPATTPSTEGMEGSSESRTQEPKVASVPDSGGASESAGISDTAVGNDDEHDERVGDPVAPATGEEVLTLEDFTVPAAMPLTWQRRYRSGNCDRDLGFGAGWSVDCLRTIWMEEEGIRVLDHQGRVVRFKPLSPGEISVQVSAGMRLEYMRDSRMVLTEKDGTAWRFSTADNHLWHPVSVQNLRGQQWRFQYDREHRLFRIEVAPERYLQLVWKRTTPQSRERLVQVLLCQDDKRSELARYDYSEAGDLVASASHHGRETYRYQDHLLTRRELPTGYGINFQWQGHGPAARCLHSRGDDGHHEFHFDYQPDQYQTTVTDAFGNTQVFHYDDQGRITARQEPDGATYQWAYDDDSGLLVAYRLPDGRTTQYGYDAWGRKVIEQLPDGRQHRWHYNAMGFCTAEQTPDGLTTRRQFDSVGRLLSEERPDGSQWRYQYDANGWMTQATSDTGEVRRIGYSANGDVLADERQGNLRRFAFDPQGRVAGYLQQDLVTEYDYEGAKLLALHQYPEQAPEQRRSRQFGYNDAGLLTSYTNAVGDTHHYDYGKLARPEAYRRPDGHSVQYDYDLEERLTRVTRADGNQWQLGWNARGKVDRCQAPDGRDIHFHYNEAGEIIRREHPGAWVQTVERDEGGRVITQTSQGKDRAPVTRHYQYDRFGRRTHASCADRKVRWSWNNKGQVTEHHQDQHTVQYTYTTGGNLETITLPDGTEVRYRYDKHGHWTHLDLNGQSAIRRTLDNQGRETDREAGRNKQAQIYDRYGCLIKRRWQGKIPATRRYRWDAESRLEAAIDSLTGDTYYERDPQGQLIKENDTIYSYDLGGNRIPEGGKVENDRLVETENDKREYDTLGAEIRVIGKTTEHRKFDAEGQLIEVKKPGIHVTYGYDALGRRAWRKSEAGTTTYLWYNDVLMGEQTPEGQWQWYIRDPKTDEPLLTLIDGQAHYYELDWRMMPIRLWDKDGELVWLANVNAWGLCQSEVPKGYVHQPIRLPGQFEDELTGIVQNRFRDYASDSGRYISADMLGVGGGVNSYRYTSNPLDLIDPLGLCASEIKPGMLLLTCGELPPFPEETPALSEIPSAPTGFWGHTKQFSAWFWEDVKTGVVRDRIIEAVKAELSIAAGIAEGALMYATGGAAGAFIGVHAAGNLSGGVGDYLNIFDNGARDWNLTRQGYENIFSFAGQDPSLGTTAFHLTDAGLGVGGLLSPVNVKVVGPMTITGEKAVPAFTTGNRTVVVHDAVQIGNSVKSGVSE